MVSVEHSTRTVVEETFVITMSLEEVEALGRFMAHATYEEMSTSDVVHHTHLWDSLRDLSVTPW